MKGGPGIAPPLRETPVAGEEALVAEYVPLAYAIARDYYLPGGDYRDTRQEALIGLLSAIRTWRPDGGMSLRSLIVLAVRRQLMTAVKAASRQKHAPLTNAVRTETNDEGRDTEVTADPLADPHHLAVVREQLAATVTAAAALTDVERRWLIVHLNGGIYWETKQGDNAMQRARRKIAAAIDLEAAA